jgi:hypothetical protein
MNNNTLFALGFVAILVILFTDGNTVSVILLMILLMREFHIEDTHINKKDGMEAPAVINNQRSYDILEDILVKEGGSVDDQMQNAALRNGQKQYDAMNTRAQWNNGSLKSEFEIDFLQPAWWGENDF